MKKIVDFLRKIGVLHASSGDFQTGEFDDRKDMGGAVGSTATSTESGAVSGKKKLLVFFWIVLVLFVLLAWIFLVSTGITFLLVVLCVFWIWFLLSIKKTAEIGVFKYEGEYNHFDCIGFSDICCYDF